MDGLVASAMKRLAEVFADCFWVKQRDLGNQSDPGF